MNAQPITGFNIYNYRSFSTNPQLLGPFKKINVFIGENNSGKSNVLRFIRDIYAPFVSKDDKSTQPADSVPQGGQPINNLEIMTLLDTASMRLVVPQLNDREIEVVRKVLGSIEPAPYTLVDCRRDKTINPVDVTAAHARLAEYEHHELYRIWAALTGKSSGNITQHWIPETVQWYHQRCIKPVKLHYVPTLRQIPTKLPIYKDEYGGVTSSATIADELAALANPDHTRPGDRRKFQAITDFVRGVLKRPALKISVPHDKSTIIIEDYDRYLPIEALGTGIHQLIILAIRAILIDDSAVCVEEPELHLHPELQHQLMNFFANKTTNQYFVTTHSATIMDAVDCDVYSVRLENGRSLIEKPITRSARRQVCHTLGYRPSDLLQSNCVVWVEGPTDRLYLLNWLKSAAPHLKEGWHFSIVFYGGKLVSHLTAEEDGIDALIEILPVNRFPAIIIDSDKSAKGKHINATKKRVTDEFKRAGGFAWITEGREIENYIEPSMRKRVLKEIYGVEFELSDEDEQFGQPIMYKTNKGPQEPNKLKFAQVACKSELSLGVLDLEQRIGALVEFIHKANRIEHIQSDS